MRWYNYSKLLIFILDFSHLYLVRENSPDEFSSVLEGYVDFDASSLVL